MQIIKKKIGDLKSAPYNPRYISKQELTKLKDSIDKFGYVEPIIWNKRTGYVVGGHQRLAVLSHTIGNDAEIEVVVVDLEQSQEKALNLALNKISGDWDKDKLTQLLQDLHTNDEAILKYTGFDNDEINRLLKIETPEIFNIDKALKRPKYNIELWDRYLLGKHTLLCGDSTQEEDVNLLMGNETADLIFTDPPYNVDYKGMQNSKQWESIQNDAMTKEQFTEFLKASFKQMYKHSTPKSAAYVCHADKTHTEFRQAFESEGYEWRATCIWVKNSPAFNFAQYKYAHEPIFYLFKKGENVNWYGDNTQNTLWPANKEIGEHPTIKPTELIKKAILNSSKETEVVLDLFGGSGSTLITCEQLNRKCKMMEISPTYCSVIIERWENLTGQKATLISNGKESTQ